VITLIHRQEKMSLLGFPLMRPIDIDDAESVLKAIRGTPSGKTIEIILHTPGGLVLAASQIARALADHDGRVVARARRPSSASIRPCRSSRWPRCPCGIKTRP
jgi:ClpP class serine protease